MEKIKKFVKKNQILLIAVCVCIAALTVAFFAGGNRSENKVQTASTASSLSTTNADTETTSVSATEKNHSKILPIPLNRTKIKRTEKIPKIKKNSKDNSQNVNSSAVEKSEKSEQSSNNSSSDKKKTVFFIKQFFKTEQKE